VRKLDSPLMGVREWSVGNDGELGSTGMGGVWSKGTQKATCKSNVFGVTFRYHADEFAMPNQRHRAPHKSCGCGLYAFYNHDALIKHGDNISAKLDGISGVVSAWGKIIRCEYGFRAEYMKLEALIIEHAERSFWGTTLDMREAYRSLAERHGVPLIKSYEISAFMGLSGGSVLECEETPLRPITDASVVDASGFTWAIKAYQPTRYVVAYHSDYRSEDGSRRSWVEYSDGTTEPMAWNTEQMKGGQNG
jgi:hypothetical protein